MGNKTIDVLIGGFGALRGGNSPGVEHYALHLTGGAGVGTEFHDSGATEIRNPSLRRLGVLAPLPSPGWLEREGRMLYALLEDSDEIATFELTGSHDSLRATVVARVPSASKGPTHAAVAIDDLGRRHLVVANYGDGVIGVHPARLLPVSSTWAFNVCLVSSPVSRAADRSRPPSRRIRH